MQNILCIHPQDDMLVALTDLKAGETVRWENENIRLVTPVATKHKFARRPLATDEIVKLYGVPVGKAMKPIALGEVITTENLKHYAAEVEKTTTAPYNWSLPDVSRWEDKTFMGYVREDGRVGTANYWLIFPLVFCENRNVEHLRNALEGPLGYAADDLTSHTFSLLGEATGTATNGPPRPFPNVDGLRIITHVGGCGGTRNDARSLCRILSTYADHPNVAGITVFSLGCQNAEISMFEKYLKEQNPDFNKPYFIFEQQKWDSEPAMMKAAIRDTLEGMKEANKAVRTPVPLSHLKIGVKCGGSDGFSGITANPAMGLLSDMVVALGGSSILAEFPELCGVEANLIERCVRPEDGDHFLQMMRDFEAKAKAVGSSFSDNPSPGNIRDGLITDAMKSAGAAKKGGTSPVVSVLDYGEQVDGSGLALLCTPGGDVEAVTGIVSAGANVVLFSTGLGTPTGNPIVPVLKIATNTPMAERLKDMIDFDCGPVIEGVPLSKVADDMLDLVIATASGEHIAKADNLHQYDFMFWKRDTSL